MDNNTKSKTRGVLLTKRQRNWYDANIGGLRPINVHQKNARVLFLIIDPEYHQLIGWMINLRYAKLRYARDVAVPRSSIYDAYLQRRDFNETMYATREFSLREILIYASEVPRPWDCLSREVRIFFLFLVAPRVFYDSGRGIFCKFFKILGQSQKIWRTGTCFAGTSSGGPRLLNFTMMGTDSAGTSSAGPMYQIERVQYPKCIFWSCWIRKYHNVSKDYRLRIMKLWRNHLVEIKR